MRKAIINYTMWFTLYAAYLFVGAQYGWYALLLVLPLAFAMLCIVYIPQLNVYLHTQPLGGAEFRFIGAALGIFALFSSLWRRLTGAD